MKGSIRIFLGFLLVFGAVGGMDNPDQAEFFIEQMIIAGIGLFFMVWGVRAINGEIK